MTAAYVFGCFTLQYSYILYKLKCINNRISEIRLWPGNDIMKRVLIENIVDKMVLAKEVCGTSGSILLAKGTMLTASMGHRLKNWGVQFVYVDGEEDSAQAGAAGAVSPEEIRTQLEEKFSRVIGNEIMKKIFAAVYKFKIQHNT